MSGFLDWIASIDEMTVRAIVSVLCVSAVFIWCIVQIVTGRAREHFDDDYLRTPWEKPRKKAEKQAIKEEKKRRKAEAKYWAEIEKKYNS